MTHYDAQLSAIDRLHDAGHRALLRLPPHVLRLLLDACMLVCIVSLVVALIYSGVATAALVASCGAVVAVMMYPPARRRVRTVADALVDALAAAASRALASLLAPVRLLDAAMARVLLRIATTRERLVLGATRVRLGVTSAALHPVRVADVPVALP